MTGILTLPDGTPAVGALVWDPIMEPRWWHGAKMPAEHDIAAVACDGEGRFLLERVPSQPPMTRPRTAPGTSRPMCEGRAVYVLARRDGVDT